MSTQKWAVAPIALELVFYQFFEHESDDSLFNGADDEIFIQGTAFDTAELTAANVLPTHAINLPTGDVSDPATNLPWVSDTNPYVVYRFDLKSNPVFPRTCAVQLQVIENDNGDLAESFRKLDEKYREKLSKKISDLGAKLIAMGGDALVPGSGPYVQEFAELILNELTPIALGAIADPIFEGLRDEQFLPEPFSLYLPNRDYDFHDNNLFPGYYVESPPEWVWSPLRSLHLRADNAHYEFVFYWKIQREVVSYNEPVLESRRLATEARSISVVRRQR